MREMKMDLRQPPTRLIKYPQSDGKPMAESDLHFEVMVRIWELLARFFLGQRVYVTRNLLIYYEEGNPRKSVAPDAFVVKNCDPRKRKVYKLWVERKMPDFVMETTSSSTRKIDVGKKQQIYAELGVPEYFLYDPTEDWLEPPLQGFRLANGQYEPIKPIDDGSLASNLGITFKQENGTLGMFDTATGERLKTAAERAEAAFEAKQAAEQRAEEALEAKQAAEIRAQELADELARLRAELEQKG